MNSNKRKAASENPILPEKKQKTAFYLEDYTPIRTIEVTNLSDNVCPEYLRGYFEHFGPVKSVVINSIKENDKEECVAYVTFVLPEDAGKLICDKSLQFNFRFSVKEAAAMYQPKVDPNILKLTEVNDDCLLHIMSYLNLIDVVNLGKTSIRLQSVTKQLYSRKSHFSFGSNTGDSSINEINLPIILKETGEFIQSIEWYELNPTDLDILVKCCPNVSIMKLVKPSTALSSHHFKKNKTFFEKLKRLHIHNSHLFDTAMKILISSPTLKTLNLEECRNIRGKFFPRKAMKLKHLRIIRCTMLTYYPAFWDTIKDVQWKNKLFTFAVDKCCSYVSCLTSPPEILAKFKELQLDFSCPLQKNLKELNFSGLTRLTAFTVTRKHSNLPAQNFNNVITAIAQIKTLESLCIERIEINNDTLKCLASIQNLKDLKLNNVTNTIGKRLYVILPIHLPNLTVLSMLLDIAEINIKSICDTVAALPQLRFFSHSSITWELLDMILKIQLTRKNLTMNVGISKLMFDDPKTKEFNATNKGSIILSLNI